MLLQSFQNHEHVASQHWFHRNICLNVLALFFEGHFLPRLLFIVLNTHFCGKNLAKIKSEKREILNFHH